MGRPTEPGVLLLSSTLEVVYVNPEGRAFLHEFIMRPGPAVDLPPTLRSCCEKLIQSLSLTPGAPDWESLRHTHILASSSGRILLRAFGVPTPLDKGNGQLLLLLERVGLSHDNGHSQPFTSNPIHLTPREVAVMRYLLEGLTNKEIASKLRLSEHTVKDHLKRMMKKTQVTTRTAVVSRLLSDHTLLVQLSHETPCPEDAQIHDLAG